MVTFSTDLTFGVHRGMVRAKFNWRFLIWSVIARDLDTYVSLNYKPLHQYADNALATIKDRSQLKP